MRDVLEKINRIFSKLKDDHISEYAAECAYFTILSFIPFIIIFITLIQYTNIDKDTIYFIAKELIPSNMQNLIVSIIDEVYSKSVGTISIAAIVALWSAGKGFFSLCKGFKTIYKVQNKKPNMIMRIEGTIYTLFFIIAIISVLVIRVFGNRIYELTLGRFEYFTYIVSYILRFRALLLIIVLFIVFLLIYKFIPKHKQKIVTQIYGAFFSAVAWYITSWFFSIYIDIFKGFSNTYGSLTSIILVMMWVYVCMYIILIGAEINTLVQEYKYKLLSSKKI